DGLGGVGVDVAGEHSALVAPTPHLGGGGGDGGVAQPGVVGGPRIGQCHPYDLQIGEGDVAAGAGHAVRVPGSGPAGDPSALAVLLDESVGELGRQLRVQQRIGRPGGAVGVPEAVVDVEHAGQLLRVAAAVGGLALGRQHRAGVHRLRTLGGAGVLPVGAGIEVQAVEVPVQRAALR